MPEAVRVRGVLTGPLAQDGIPLPPSAYQIMGRSLVRIMASEAREYFARRGWSGKDPMKGPPIWKSFKWKLRGQHTIELISSFYGMAELARGNIPARKMTWLTQQNKDQHPDKFPLTKRERELGMRQSGRVSRGQRLPLIIPIQTDGGDVEFRTAPLTLGEAWIHPGIAKFTFLERALRKWRAECAQIVTETIASSLRTR